MDIQLPGIDGIEALRELRRRRTAAIPIVAVTASAMTQDRQRFMAAGFDGYQAKPIDPRLRPLLDCRRADRGETEATSRDRRAILVVDDTPANIRLLEAMLDAAGYAVRPPRSGAEALERVAGSRARPRAARHRDAGHGRLRGLPADPRDTAARLPAGRHGHRERQRGEGQGARGRRRRLPDQAGQPARAAGPGRVAAPDQALPRHDQAPGGRAGRAGTASSRRASQSRWRSWSGWRGCAGSCRRSSPS